MSSNINILSLPKDILEKIIFKPFINKECQVIFNINIPSVFNECIEKYNIEEYDEYIMFLMYKIIHYVGLLSTRKERITRKERNILFNQALKKIKVENLYKEILNNVIKYDDIYLTPFYRVPEDGLCYKFGCNYNRLKKYCPKSVINILKEITKDLNNNIKNIYSFITYYHQFASKFYDVYFSRIVSKYIINMDDDIKEKLKNNTMKHCLGKNKQAFEYCRHKKYRDEYWLGEYYDKIINNENNNFMFEVCERFIYTGNIYVLQDGEIINFKENEILEIIENQETMKSIIYK